METPLQFNGSTRVQRTTTKIKPLPKLPPIPGIDYSKLAPVGGGLFAGVLTIRPSTARAWLTSCQRKNRPVSAAAVERYSRAIQAGDWKLNGETIVFSNTGVQFDGGHRTRAIASSAHPVKALVVVGVEDTDETMASVDMGLVRTGGQVLRMAEYSHATVLSAMADTVYRYFNGMALSAKLDSITRLHVVKERPEIGDFANVSYMCAKNFRGFPSSHYAGLSYLFSLTDTRKAADFTEHFIEGTELRVGSPILALRTAATRAAQSRGRFSQSVWHPMIIKAWNAYVNGTELRTLKLGAKEPRLPEIIGLPKEV